MKTLAFFSTIALTIFLFSNASQRHPVTFEPEDSVAEILVKLGDEPLPHQPDLTVEGASAEQGEKLVLTGFAQKPAGGETSKQSAHFVCTSCHNIQREEPDLSVTDAQVRLEYAKENGLPFLQGSPLYGVVNRTSYYNGDYDKKYGDLVKKARNNLREAIQLCATECAQGRALDPWEMESILAYLWTIDLKMNDLILSEEEYTAINVALNNETEQTAAIELIKSKYMDHSPATFVTPPDDRKVGYPNIQGDPANGKLIYKLSCLHCHEKQRYAFFELDNSQLTFQHLAKHFPKYTRYSIYQVSRWGTSPVPGKKAYMPQYTLEKMTHQQLEDLRAYVEQQAKGDSNSVGGN